MANGIYYSHLPHQCPLWAYTLDQNSEDVMNRFIKVTENDGTDIYFNPSQVTHVCRSTNGDIMIILSCGRHLRTKFTDCSHAIDFIQRAEIYIHKGEL